MASAIPSVKVANCQYNLQQIESLVATAEGKGVEIIVFPELSVTGYTCQDLFRQQLLLEQAELSVMKLLDFTRSLDIICIRRPASQLCCRNPEGQHPRSSAEDVPSEL